jgi:hypothetical protein
MCILLAIYLVIQCCLTIGYGDVAPQTFNEKVLLSVYVIFGVVIFSYFMATFSNYFEEKIYSTNEKEHLIRNVEKIERKLSRQNP